ncbi:MAG: low molecular weight protein arginine phosphatase [Clostridiaceae bacterium]|nr:low molecular weight protein arginine phosphatase [Clostridiaceae bacterium]HZW97240.1 low molecular weight protein arginine phosphatase [Bacillota bacterium]
MQILFVCMGNTCRSPMAEVMFNTHTPNRDWEAASAGIATWNGMMASLPAIDEMEARGMSLDHHRSRQIDADMIEAADLVLSMTANHKRTLLQQFPEYKDKIFTLGEYAKMPEAEVQDPFGQGAESYLNTANQLVKLLQAIFDMIEDKSE